MSKKRFWWLLVPAVTYSLQLAWMAVQMKNHVLLPDWSMWRMLVLVSAVWITGMTLSIWAAEGGGEYAVFTALTSLFPWLLCLVVFPVWSLVFWGFPAFTLEWMRVPFAGSYMIPALLHMLRRFIQL